MEEQGFTKPKVGGSIPSFRAIYVGGLMITFIDEDDGTISVYRYKTKIMRINTESRGHFITTIFNSYESLCLRTVEDTKKFILDMYK